MQAASSFISGTLSRRALVFVRGYATTAAAAAGSASTNRDSTQTKQTFASLLGERAGKFEHKDLLIAPAEDIRHTFIEVNAKVDGLARGFVEHVIRPGDTIVSLLPDTSAQLYNQLAAARAGITYVPLSPDTPTETLVEKLKQTKARGLIVPDVIGNRNYIQELYDAIPELDAVTEEFQPFRSRNQLPNLRLLAQSSDKRYQGFLRLSTIPVRGLSPDPLNKLPTTAADHPALILSKSDSGASDQISQHDLINTGHSILQSLSIGMNDRIALGTQYDSIAYYLAAGCISHGAVLVQPSKGFNADSIVRSIGKDKITVLVVSAKELPSILQSKELSRTNISSLRTVVIWGKSDASHVSSTKDKLKVKDVYVLDSVGGKLTGSLHNAEGKTTTHTY